MTHDTGLRRGLNARHIRFMALGSAIGTGLFYGSASAIQMAGPAVLLAYLVAGAAVYMVMRALGEMAVHEPVSGSFGHYASSYLGPLAGFVTGWTYAFEMIIVCLADVTAFGIYMGFWFPDVPRWIWVLSIVLFIGGLNLCHVKVFGELEFWLSLVKVGAIVAMILAGLGIMFFGFSLGGAATSATGVHNLWQHGGFLPNGWAGLVASLSVVVFAFGGIEIIGITAGEAQDPQRVIPRAINAVPLRILLFYVLTLFVLMAIFPWQQIGSNGSPFVQIFDGLGIESAAAILNVVVITAAISAINSDIFGAGRMLYGMARQGQAPVGFAGVAARRAVDDRAADGGGPAARRGAELPDPAERIPVDRFHRHLRHRVGLADDPPGPGRHAPAHGATPGRRAEVPGAAVAIRAGGGDRLHAVHLRGARLFPGHPPGPVGRGYLDRLAGDRLPALGQAEGRCRAWRASGPGRAVTEPTAA